MTRSKLFTLALGIIFSTSIVTGVYAQPNSTPQLPREAQEVISAAAETIRQDKMTIESRSQRIQMMRDQIEAAQIALDLAIQNGNLCEEVRLNQLSEIRFLKDQYTGMKAEMKKERRRKIFWKCTTITLSGVSLYLLLL
jgi:hypothetical protein